MIENFKDFLSEVFVFFDIDVILVDEFIFDVIEFDLFVVVVVLCKMCEWFKNFDMDVEVLL